VAERERLLGYICFGPTPMTDGTFDLYCIATDPGARGQGVGSALIRAMEDELKGRGGRIVRVETSAQEAYGPTRGFYQANHYEEEARFRDFYKPGDDLVILAKRLR
jgi:ribosomal protein S18 acetylase RimI-like enzyme